MPNLLIFRKAPVKKISAATIKEIMLMVNAQSRVNRDEVVEFMLKGGFAKLPLTKQSEVDSENWHRPNENGWVVPKSCLGRKGVATLEQRESLRIWIKDRLKIDPDTFSVVWVP